MLYWWHKQRQEGTTQGDDVMLYEMIDPPFDGDFETGECYICREPVTVREAHLGDNPFVFFHESDEEGKWPCCGESCLERLEEIIELDE